MARIQVRVHAGASRSQRAWDGHILQLWVTQPPVEGAANAAVVRAVAAWAGTRRSAVRIVTGARGRDKVVEIDGPAALPAIHSHRTVSIQ